MVPSNLLQLHRLRGGYWNQGLDTNVFTYVPGAPSFAEAGRVAQPYRLIHPQQQPWVPHPSRKLALVFQLERRVGDKISFVREVLISILSETCELLNEDSRSLKTYKIDSVYHPPFCSEEKSPSSQKDGAPGLTSPLQT